MNHKGITLIELIIVVAIIGLLAVIGVPAYIGQQKNATRTEAYTNLQNLRLLEEQFFSENAVYAPSRGVVGADQPGNITLIRNAGGLPGFNPGGNLSFSYQILQNASIASPTAGSTAAPCFLAIATGNTTSRVAGDSFMIDCNNNRNF